jgi:exodeoxyribonuclease VII small subunit
MADESYSFSTARTRLEAIVTQVRKKDTSLEKSLDLLEEGVRLANACTELIDHADWVAAGVGSDAESTETDAVSQDPDDAADTTDEAVGAETAVEEPDPGHAEDDGAVAAVDSADADEPEYSPDDGDPADEAWADQEPSDSLGADDDPSADER